MFVYGFAYSELGWDRASIYPALAGKSHVSLCLRGPEDWRDEVLFWPEVK